MNSLWRKKGSIISFIRESSLKRKNRTGTVLQQKAEGRQYRKAGLQEMAAAEKRQQQIKSGLQNQQKGSKV